MADVIGKKEMVALIIAPEDDAHVKSVQEQLARLGRSSYCLHSARLLKSYTFNLQVGEGVPACELVPQGYTGSSESAGPVPKLDINSVSAVWLRRWTKLKAPDIPEPWAARIVEGESTRALEGLLRILPCLWVNRPGAQSEASYKIPQLEMARQCGLAVPKTLVTNDPVEVSDFYEATGRQMIYKMIDESTWQRFPKFEIPNGLPTMLFRESDLAHLEQVKLGLHLFQERVDKEADIRVTVVGQKIFAAKIDSQQGKGSVDFRLDYSVPSAVYELPDDVSEKCLQLMRKLGLNFGAIDLCLARDGRHVFLEVNAQGQWLWLEIKLDLPISLHMARLLAEIDSPLIA